MLKHKIVEIYHNMPDTKKIINEKYDGKFTVYIEDRMDEYIMNTLKIQINMINIKEI